MLLPLRILWRDPAGLNSADSPGACRCDDGCDYAIKDAVSHPRTPHNEFFCSSLANAVGIAGPPWAILEEAPGQFVFGSRWEGGVAKDHLLNLVSRGEITLDDVKPALTRIFVFDHFVFNEDRHLGNYLIREQKNGLALFAFDYSRAWLYRGFPPHPLPFQPTQNTRLVAKLVSQAVGSFIDLGVVDEAVGRLRNVPATDVENIIERHPKDWLTDAERRDIVSWWNSTERLARLEAIRQGIRDGSYL